MKNKLLTLAGVLALLAVIGKFYAGPAIAQTVRAALVQDRDSYPRQPFSIRLGYNGTNVSIPPPPAGKRMVITSMSFSVSFLVPTGVTSVSVYTNGGSEGRNYQNYYGLAPLTGNEQWTGNFAYNWVLDPDGAGEIFFDSNPYSSSLTANIIVTGYYIDVP